MPAPVVLAVLAALTFLVNLGYGIVLPVLPTLASATAFDVGTMYSAFSATKLFAQLYGGAAADRFGAGLVLRLGVVIYGVSLAGLAMSHSVASVLVFRVLEGIAVGIAVPAVSALVLGASDASSFTKRHSIVLGVGGAGMVMGPVVGLLVGRHHVREAMVAIAVLTVASAIALPTVGKHRTATDSDAFAIRSLLRYAGSTRFILLVLPLFFGKLAFGVMQPLVPMHAARISMSDATVASLFALTGILFAGMQPIVGSLRSIASNRVIAISCAVAAAVCLGAIACFHDALGFSVCYLAYVVFGSMLFGANSGLVGETYHEAESDHGKIFGAMHSVTDASLLLGPPLLLALYETSLVASFVALAVTGALFAIAFARGTPELTPRTSGSRT